MPPSHLPNAPPEDGPQDWAWRDLHHAVTVALARDHALLTRGELCVARHFLALPHGAACLYARLLSRRGDAGGHPRVFPLATLRYGEIADCAAAADDLVRIGFADRADRLAPTAWLLQACTVAELKTIARALGRPVGGRRDDLLERLHDARSQAAQPALVLRHRRLFRRLCRLYLHDHDGDLSKLVVARLEHIQYPDYTPTGGAGLFPNRRALTGYERARERAHRLLGHGAPPTGEALIADLPRAIRAFQQTPPTDAVRARFSGRRYDLAIGLAGARELERTGAVAEARQTYEALLGAAPRHPEEVVHRLALCRGRLGDPAAGARLCAEWTPLVSRSAACALERTGSRLARAADLPWRALPRLQAAPARVLHLQPGSAEANRPTWHGRQGPLPVEAAVVDWLSAAGREAFHGENAPWKALFALIFDDIIFAPVDGMLPTPLLLAPLDWGTPEFYLRRAGALEARLDAVSRGQGAHFIRAALGAGGARVPGEAPDLFTGDRLLCLVADLGGEVLSTVLGCYARDWREARRGMPDLTVLPAASEAPASLRGLFPADLPACAFLVEVKGPTDSLQDAQRVWHDQLLRAGVQTEIWKVRPSPAPPRAGPPPCSG